MPPTLFEGYQDVVRPEWIDDNGHFNIGYYAVVFDFATDAWLDFIGLSAEGKARWGVTTFALESHTNFLRELPEAAPLRFTTRLLGFDSKRIHYFHEMYHATEGFLSATNELLSLHVSRATRRGTPMSDELTATLHEVLDQHRSMPLPPQVGRRIGLDAKP